MSGARWLYHVRVVGADPGWPYAPASLAREGFVHASFRDRVRESAKLYFPAGSALEVLVIDPRLLAAPVEIALTPRGPMPHVRGPIEERSVVYTMPLLSFDEHELSDFVTEAEPRS